MSAQETVAIIRAQRCETCANWTQYKGEGFCGSLYQHRAASSGCKGWLPVFRRLGELRKSFDAHRTRYLRLSAVRRLFGHGKITADQILPLVTRDFSTKEAEILRGAVSVWPEYREAKALSHPMADKVGSSK